MTTKRSIEHVNRRRLLKATGAVALGSAAFSGNALAHPPEEIRFCGCSQVCLASDESYRIVYATEDDRGYTCRVDAATDESAESEPGCFKADEDEKIIGVLGGSRTLYPNPNTCANRALDDIDLNECAGCEDDNCDDVATYNQVGRHEYEVVGSDVIVRTRLCKPPQQWDDEPNGPPRRGRGRSSGNGKPF